MKALIGAWQALLNAGTVYSAADKSVAQEVRHINESGVAVFVFLIPSVALAYWLYPYKLYWLVMACFAFAFALTVYFNALRLYGLAKAWIFIVSDVLIFWASSTFGFESDIHYLLIIIIFAVILNYRPSYDPALLAISVATLLTGVALYLTDFSLFLEPNLSPEKQYIISVACLFTCLACAASLSIFYISSNLRQTQKLERTAQDLRQKYEELEKVNKELDRFVYSVSHDLRAPVASLLGLEQLTAVETDPAQLAKYAAMREQSLRRLDRFIKQISDHSLNARLDVQVAPVDLEALIGQSVQGQQLNYFNHQVETLVEVQQPQPFATDPQRLLIVLNNLIANAIAYSDDRKGLPMLKITAQVEADKAVIQVSDNGIGIHEQHLPHVFNMFYKGTERSRGSGLGLYVAKEAIDALQGEISVFSTVGEGSSFKLVVPNMAAQVLASPG